MTAPTNGGWDASAAAWIAQIDRGDSNRTLLLDRVVLAECGGVAGSRVLDLGCGEGRFARMLEARGSSVVGLDVTRELLRAARERSAGSPFVRATAELLPFPDRSFDLVISYLSLVDIPDFRGAIQEAERVLGPGGNFVVANTSFMSAAKGWIRDADGRRLHYPIDDYLSERPVELSWAGIEIINWHRPLAAYMDAFLSVGLELRSFREPMPEDDRFRDDPRLEDWYRVPNFVVMRWQKHRDK